MIRHTLCHYKNSFFKETIDFCFQASLSFLGFTIMVLTPNVFAPRISVNNWSPTITVFDLSKSSNCCAALNPLCSGFKPGYTYGTSNFSAASLIRCSLLFDTRTILMPASFNERTQASKFSSISFSSQPISVLSKSVKTTSIPFSCKKGTVIS